nr:hypothetical protein L203_05897 [Cryptococcus depauperatus CBS 7841]
MSVIHNEDEDEDDNRPLFLYLDGTWHLGNGGSNDCVTVNWPTLADPDLEGQLWKAGATDAAKEIVEKLETMATESAQSCLRPEESFTVKAESRKRRQEDVYKTTHRMAKEMQGNCCGRRKRCKVISWPLLTC